MKRSSSLAETRCCIATRIQGGSGDLADEGSREVTTDSSGVLAGVEPIFFLLAVVPGMPPAALRAQGLWVRRVCHLRGGPEATRVRECRKGPIRNGTRGVRRVRTRLPSLTEQEAPATGITFVIGSLCSLHSSNEPTIISSKATQSAARSAPLAALEFRHWFGREFPPLIVRALVATSGAASAAEQVVRNAHAHVHVNPSSGEAAVHT